MNRCRNAVSLLLVIMLNICISSSSLFSFSLLGSYQLSLAGSALALLAIGGFSGFSSAISFWLGRGLLRIALHGAGSAFGFLNGLPTLVGVAAMNYPRLVVVLVVGGSVAFWLHPVGLQAAAYPLLWVIPLLALFGKGVAARMIIGSFCAHIVGSLIWLYAGFLVSPAAWILLIPRVLVERVSLAAVALLVSVISSGFSRSFYNQKIEKQPVCDVP